MIDARQALQKARDYLGCIEFPPFSPERIALANLVRTIDETLSGGYARDVRAERDMLADTIRDFIEHCNEQERGWYSDGVAGLAAALARAQGGEARRAETPLSGSVADEHPVAEGDAP